MKTSNTKEFPPTHSSIKDARDQCTRIIGYYPILSIFQSRTHDVQQ